jgi:division protein CdvB (Snf7/Vps24/ESCRT-III family)
MKDKIRELYKRLRDVVVKVQNDTGEIEVSTTYANANNIMMSCMIENIKPTSEEMNYVELFVEYYEEKASGMVSEKDV